MRSLESGKSVTGGPLGNTCFGLAMSTINGSITVNISRRRTSESALPLADGTAIASSVMCDERIELSGGGRSTSAACVGASSAVSKVVTRRPIMRASFAMRVP